MIMKVEHYEELKKRIAESINKLSLPINCYAKDARIIGQSFNRFMWGLFWSTKYFNNSEEFKYLNDSHIETALHKIGKELNINEW